jgi:elongation factor Ts
MVKALREETSQGMMECKKALQETDGDFEAAKDLLRKTGAVKAEKKAERSTAEGLVKIRLADGEATMVELQCETDFCARNDEFQAMAERVADLAAAADPGEIAQSDTIGQAVQDCLAKIGENMSYARGVKLAAEKVGSYLHHNNKVGVVVAVDGECDDETLTKLCQHIAFADPMGLTADDVPADLVEKERQFAVEEAAESGKPAEIVEKMVEGKVRKFLAANALLEQPFVHDEKQKVKDILGSATVKSFARYNVGA